MSKNLSSVARTEFDTEVKQAYQMASKLRPHVTLRTNVVGDTYKFRAMGKGLANQKPSQADVTPMDVTHSTPTVTLANWTAPEYTDIFDAAEVNFDEQRELAQTIAMALGRRFDQLVIDAMGAGSLAGTVVHGSAGLSTTKMREGKKYLDANGVPGSDRCFIHTADGLEDILGDTQAQNSDYNTIKALVNGELNTWLGFTWVMIETRAEGGLPKDGSNTVDNFGFHKAAVGVAEGISEQTEVNYIAHKTSWLANGLLKAGAVTRDSDGVVKIESTEA